MNVTLKPFDFARAAARAGIELPTAAGAEKAKAAAPAGFQNAMSKALKEVSQAQLTASAMQREVTMDNPTVSIEQTMVAMQKGQVAFTATLQTRNKLVQAYSEIMNMQV
jgi:flagellar hook-basal body complex protein FliE